MKEFNFDKEIKSLKKEFPNESNKFYTDQLLKRAREIAIGPIPDLLIFDEP